MIFNIFSTLYFNVLFYQVSLDLNKILSAVYIIKVVGRQFKSCVNLELKRMHAKVQPIFSFECKIREQEM